MIDCDKYQYEQLLNDYWKYSKKQIRNWSILTRFLINWADPM